MSTWPYTSDGDLVKAGYEFVEKGRCRGAHCEVGWRTPKKKMIPLDPGTMKPHWSTCPDARSFR